MKNIQKCDRISALHNSLLNELGILKELGICFSDKGILVWRLFSLRRLTSMPFNLKSSGQPRYSTVSCCLME